MENKKCNNIQEFKEIMLEKTQSKRKRFFTSDIHFQDDRLNLYGRDLMFKNSQEVDEYVIDMWNKTIDKKDLVILVGDVSMTKEGLDNLDKLNGEKWLVKGNYDISVEDGGTAKYEISDKILSKYFTKIVDDLELEIGGEIVYINHFPTNARSNSFNITGHIHGTWKVQRNMVNVGVDAWHFVPVSEDLIKFQMNGIRVHYDQNVYAGELKANIENRKGEIRVLRAPEYDITENNDDVIIFLAGPIQGAPEWQEEFIEKIQKELKDIKTNKNIIICSPRRLKKDNFVYEQQVDWETYYLDKASKQGIIVFWLAKEIEKIEGRSYAQTTRFEIGEWWSKGQEIKDFTIIIGAQKSFDGLKYITKKFTEIYPKFQMISKVDDMINEIVEKIKEKIKINN
jgi:calcineurin-like phosphoesterase family protein